MEYTFSLDISKDQLNTMAGLIERAVASSLRALIESEPLLAQDVIENDKVINSYEIDIDNSTYNILTVSQVPSEILRTILSIQKINAILERIGDHAVNIAESAISLIRQSSDKDLFEIPLMADLCKKILHDGLISFFENKLDLAKNVLTRDNEIDSLNRSISNSIKEKVHGAAMSFDIAMELIRICKNLERIADLSTNIAEETGFTMIGKSVKHHAE